MPKKSIITSSHNTTNASIRSYILGFVLSLIFTLAAYFVTVAHISHDNKYFSYVGVVVAILVLAILQLFVQLRFFIHLGHEQGPKWNKLVFTFMILIVFIVVAGSIWIMNNLHYNMSPSEVTDHIMHEEGIHK